MNSVFNKLLYSIHRKILFFLIIILQLFHWGLIFWRIKPINSPISLHYNVYYGLDWFGPGYYLYFYSGLGLILIIINFLLVLFFVKQNVKVMVDLLLYLTLFFNVILIGATMLLMIFYF